ncbi:DUF2971 domain-containing protein [Marinomonas sp. IMCC 4694]|uniref:DUF2971 domain-containing protein n=1 Tax=Marinomonas sp. IMCC 4694 TaxID=2605432 RepID=UPI0011E7ECEC|nr:DUF2971 domain-containing protein [Marinomonas sp. IMCC 4694]TYL46730.1 DUF2971 domain-containing protein [Marinomonas sp. IMCC 4694]
MINDKENVAHYSKSKNLSHILKDKKIRFGRVSGLNDPRESSLGWIDVSGIGNEHNIEKYIEANDIKNYIGENLRLLCTTQHCENDLSTNTIETKIYGLPRMWAQYGENSKGFCIILNQKNLNQEIELETRKSEHIIADKVNYVDWLSIVNGSITIEYGEELQPSQKNIFETINENQFLKHLYFKKNIDWSGEKEFRWLIYSERKEDILVSIQSSIEAVVLGCDFSPEKHAEVKKYCADLGCSCFMLRYQHPRYILIPLLE